MTSDNDIGQGTDGNQTRISTRCCINWRSSTAHVATDSYIWQQTRRSCMASF